MAKPHAPLRSPVDGANGADPRRPVTAAADPHAEFVARLFERIGERLGGYVTSLLGNRPDAEDVLQETYLRLLGQRGLEQTESRARAYAYRVATNLAHDRFRRRETTSLEALGEADAPVAAHDPPQLVDLARGLERVEQTLLELKPRCRRVFLLRVAEELSYESIADVLGIGKRTVEREMRHALEVLQRRLKP
jgi:RNA polymerase sigma-70 factor (ECF subfamily)